jgi:hypothetical protein
MLAGIIIILGASISTRYIDTSNFVRAVTIPLPYTISTPFVLHSISYSLFALSLESLSREEDEERARYLLFQFIVLPQICHPVSCGNDYRSAVLISTNHHHNNIDSIDTAATRRW